MLVRVEGEGEGEGEVLDNKLNIFIEIFNSTIKRLDKRIDNNENGEQGIYFLSLTFR